MSKNEILEKLRENSKKRTGTRARNREYTISTDVNVDIRLSPQAITCLEILFANKKTNMMEAEVIELLEKSAEKFGKTKQSPWKIFQYYRKSLVEAGFISVEKK